MKQKKTNNIEERLNAEVNKRLDYYEKNEPADSTHMAPIHYVLAVLLAAAGLVMTILGAVIK